MQVHDEEKTENRHYADLVRGQIRELYANPDQSVAHRWDHVERVLANARKIAPHFPDVDLELLTLAALLHDVTSPFNRKEEHVELSMQTAQKILHEIGYPPDRTERVLAIMAEHSTERLKTGNLSSVEARILFDADKIDGLGPNGIARVFALFGQRGYPPPFAIAWYRKKIETSRSNMKTDPGRMIAMERLPCVEDFLHRFEAENALPEYKKQNKK
ncbi:MAG: HD domain-containing protein [Methanoregula sp.]